MASAFPLLRERAHGRSLLTEGQQGVAFGPADVCWREQCELRGRVVAEAPGAIEPSPEAQANAEPRAGSGLRVDGDATPLAGWFSIDCADRTPDWLSSERCSMVSVG